MPSGIRVTDGNRTRDVQYHKLVLCLLSYGHQGPPSVPQRRPTSTNGPLLGGPGVGLGQVLIIGASALRHMDDVRVDSAHVLLEERS